MYLFAGKQGVWKQKAKLVSNDGMDGDPFGSFGTIAVSGETVLVGADSHATAATGLLAGAAYVFRPKGGGWSQIVELTASDGVSSGFFGGNVAIQNNLLLIGASGQHPQVDNGQGYPGGEAYVYRLDQ